MYFNENKYFVNYFFKFCFIYFMFFVLLQNSYSVSKLITYYGYSIVIIR